MDFNQTYPYQQEKEKFNYKISTSEFLQYSSTSMRRGNNDEKNLYTFFLQNNQKNTFEQIQIDIPKRFTVEKTIRKVLDSINKKFENEGNKENKIMIYEYNKYELFSCKKNGQLKEDLPAVDKDQPLSVIGIKNFLLINPKEERNKKNFVDRTSSFEIASRTYSKSLISIIKETGLDEKLLMNDESSKLCNKKEILDLSFYSSCGHKCFC